MSLDNLNLAIIAKNQIQWAVYRWRRESGLMGAFLIANFWDSRIFAKYPRSHTPTMCSHSWQRFHPPRETFHILIYFNFAPASSTAISIISIYLNLFWSILISLIYFNQFDLFQSISIHFDSGIKIANIFWSSASHFDLFHQNKASQASCTLSTWLHVDQPFVIPAPSCWASSGEGNPSSFALCMRNFKFFYLEPV
jgi:hypothetical protein